MKKILKMGILPVIMICLAISLSACGGKEASRKDLEIIEEGEEEKGEEENKITIDDIDIDWSKLTGYAFYSHLDYSEHSMDRLLAEGYGSDFTLILMITIPDDMADLYYVDDETYKGHQHVNLLRDGEPVAEIESVDYDERNFDSDHDVLTFRTSNRIVYRATHSFDGSLNADNYSIQAPDGKEYYIDWQFTDDEEFLETKLDIYKTIEGFMWLPSRDFAVKRQDELVWDLRGIAIYIPAEFEGHLYNTFRVSDYRGETGIDSSYRTRPYYKLKMGYTFMSGWQATLSLREGTDEEEFFRELEENGLYLYITLDDNTHRLIAISEGSKYNDWWGIGAADTAAAEEETTEEAASNLLPDRIYRPTVSSIKTKDGFDTFLQPNLGCLNKWYDGTGTQVILAPEFYSKCNYIGSYESWVDGPPEDGYRIYYESFKVPCTVAELCENSVYRVNRDLNEIVAGRGEALIFAEVESEANLKITFTVNNYKPGYYEYIGEDKLGNCVVTGVTNVDGRSSCVSFMDSEISMGGSLREASDSRFVIGATIRGNTFNLTRYPNEGMTKDGFYFIQHDDEYFCSTLGWAYNFNGDMERLLNLSDEEYLEYYESVYGE